MDLPIGAVILLTVGLDDRGLIDVLNDPALSAQLTDVEPAALAYGRTAPMGDPVHGRGDLRSTGTLI